MGNGQQGGTSHHFVTVTSNDELASKRGQGVGVMKHGRVVISRQESTMAKQSWQLARDASMDLLSRKTTKLSFKQSITPGLHGNQLHGKKKYHLQPTIVPGKPLPVFRVPRMPTDKEVADITIAHKLLCEYCDGPCIGEYLRCRVCVKTFHISCLYERGHISDPTFTLPRLGKQDWSCPDCRDLTRLLNEDEVNYLISAFEKMDGNKDGYVLLNDYTEFCSSDKMVDSSLLFSHNDDEAVKSQFRLIDLRGQGAITWSDFSHYYCCKLVAAKNKTELTTKLSTKELGWAKNLFLKDPQLKVDHEHNAIITKAYFDRVLHEMIIMTKKKYGGDFVDSILYDNVHVDTTIEKLSVICWDEFVRQVVVPILLNRLNYDLKNSRPRRASIPRSLTRATVIAHVNVTSSVDVKPSVTTTPKAVTPSDLTLDESFRKYGKILEKLNIRNQQEEFRRKQMGSVVDWSIVEDVDDDNLELPKLKPNARDARQTVSEPWAVVKDMQHLRTEPILVSTTRIQMVKV